jgi:hypothetical protein
MKFQSVKEYFYKLNTIGFILLLVPLVVFIFLYYLPTDRAILIKDWRVDVLLLGMFSLVFILDLTIVQWLWKEKIRKLTKVIELASKMDGYFMASIRRLASYSVCSLLMALGFFLTADQLFTGLFLIVAGFMFLHRPSRNSFCATLNIRGTERDMIRLDLDLYTKNKKA